MLAAYNGRVETVRMLAQKGADINALNDAGQSPLAGAIFKGEAEMVKVLVELKADPRVGHPTAVDSAKMFGQRQYLDLLGATEEESRAPTPPSYRAPQTNGA
jgi:ankyrin repeat protein